MNWIQDTSMIILKSDREIDQLRRANAIVAEVFREIKGAVVPGVSTLELDRMAEELVRARGALPAFKGYRGFPGTLCISINEEVVHGIPGSRQLKEGEIVSLDMGAKLNGFYGDAALTLPVGRVDPDAAKLMEVTEKSLYLGIAMARPGNRLQDISHAVQSWVESHGFSVVRDFVGHGIGRGLHEEPQVPNFGAPHQGPRLERGMVLAIEPMVNEGTWQVKVLGDEWTVVTLDGKRSAHFEHSIAITDGEPEILSQL
jgi:methionyl aminopeptidase